MSAVLHRGTVYAVHWKEEGRCKEALPGVLDKAKTFGLCRIPPGGRYGNQWQIIHIPTGLRTARFTYRKDARATLLALLALPFDWKHRSSLGVTTALSEANLTETVFNIIAANYGKTTSGYIKAQRITGTGPDAAREH